MAKKEEKKGELRELKEEERKCPYCGKVFDSYQALGGHKPHCPQGDEHKKIKVKMLSTVSVGSDLEYSIGTEPTVTVKFYKTHKFAMKPVRQRK